MQSSGARIGIVLAAAAVVVVLFLVLREDDSVNGDPATSVAEETTTGASEDTAGTAVSPVKEPKPKPKPEVVKERIEVEGGQPVGGVAEIEIPSGEKAQITVTSPDTTDHAHLHGYDISAGLAPGEPAVIKFDATIDGVFEIELEDAVTPIAEVTVK